MIPSDLVDLSRLQFAVTAMYHFIFVPLTLGLSFMLVAMEVTRPYRQGNLQRHDPLLGQALRD